MKVPPDCVHPATPVSTAASPLPPAISVPFQDAAVPPDRLTRSKTPVAWLGAPKKLLDDVCLTYAGDAANIPICAVGPSPVSVAEPTSVQCAPSAEEYPVIVSPDLVNRSQTGALRELAPPATS